MKRRSEAIRYKLAFVTSVSLIIHINAFFSPILDTTCNQGSREQTLLKSQRLSFNLDPPSSNQFIRIQSRTCQGSRQCFELQTAVTTFSKINEKGERQSIDLHAQLHFGEEEYFDYYNSKEFSSLYDSFHYELIIDEGFLERTQSGQRRVKPSPDGTSVLMASPSDQQNARRYGLVCQVDCIDYSNPSWIHADMTRQELFASAKKSSVVGQQQPSLWALASTAPISWPGAEAVSALFRPLTPSAPLNTPVARRLFSNLFLPGNALAAVFRSLFWLSIPAPELFVMVLDWSSLLPRPSGGISQVALPVLESLLSGNLQEARKLVFGQVIVSGQQSSRDEQVLIIKRNERAIESIQQSLHDPSKKRLAVLYGGMHCSDLQNKLINLGFGPTRTSWRTAWSVEVPSFVTSKNDGGVLENIASIVSPNAVAIGLIVLPLYFLVGGVDWIATLQDVAQLVETADYLDASIETLLYLVRHVVLYLSLAKFVVDWDGSQSLFGKT